MKLQRRTLLRAGLTGPAWAATRGLAAAPNAGASFVFHVSSAAGGWFDWLKDWLYAPLTAELEKRGFPSMLVHSSVSGSDTPNEDRASAVVKALQNFTDDIALVGISNEGNFLPLVAAARPIRRLVYVNAVIPRPGMAFIEVCQTEQVAVPGSYFDKLLKASQGITDDFLKLVHEAYPLMDPVDQVCSWLSELSAPPTGGIGGPTHPLGIVFDARAARVFRLLVDHHSDEAVVAALAHGESSIDDVVGILNLCSAFRSSLLSPALLPDRSAQSACRSPSKGQCDRADAVPDR